MVQFSDPKKAQVRRAIQRLLSGERNIEALHRVMLWLRTRSYGLATIKEIGDGIAHSDERTQGIMFERIRDYFYGFDFFLRRANPMKWEANIPPDIDTLTRAVEATMRRIDPATTKMRLGFGHRRAVQAARAGLARMRASSGVLVLITNEQMRAIDHFGGMLSVAPPITQTEIANDLRGCLERHSLLLPGEEEALDKVVTFLCAYMVTLMHQTPIPISDGIDGILEAGLSKPEDGEALTVQGYVPMRSDHPQFRMGLDVFETKCGPEWCDDEIRSLPRTGGTWIPPIEMGPDGIIHFVT